MTKPPPPPTWSRRLGAAALRGTLRLGLLGLVGVGVASGAAAWAYQEYVVRNPGPQLDDRYIRGVIAQESPVYYRDGTTRIGVFFADEHREYVPFDELPRAYVAGIVAAEDGRFWSHAGVDPKHIVRAIGQNLTSGELVAGGSTLTQQTAKNLYYRPDRTLRSKLVELLNALRLEAHYEKAEILEFYANQFHVSGNGRGLGIAARYFFDKDVTELTLVENAFLAGLVKGPANYDPFLGDRDRQERGRKRAHDRTRYVLRRIVDEQAEHLAGPLPKRGDAASQAAYDARIAEVDALKVEAKSTLDQGFTLEFRKGRFRYDSSAVLDEVARRLAEAPFDEVLRTAGIDDPARAGLEVVTTLDEGVQHEALYSLWHHLTEVGAALEGLDAASFQHPESRGPLWEPDRAPRAHEFRVARVDEAMGAEGRRYLRLDLGGVECFADREAMSRVATAIARGRKKDRNAKASASDVDRAVEAFPKGAIVWASIRATDDGAGRAVCDLEVRPELQGAVVVLDHGQVRAMVGGSDNRNFNRAGALRQLGSTWKPLVYHAALESGWSSTDLLDNRRNVFPFSTTHYWPSPDHSPPPFVSLGWAGTNSENLASVWLLYHLLDRLDEPSTARLAKTFDLARRPDEPEQAYRLRIQKEGVLPTPRRVDEAFFLQARQEVDATLADGPYASDRVGLASLLYGWGLDPADAGGDPERARSLGWTWKQVAPRLEACTAQHLVLSTSLAEGFLPAAPLIPDLSVRSVDGKLRVACGIAPGGYQRPDEDLLVDDPTTGAMPVLDAEADVWLDGAVHLGTLRQLQTGIERRRLAREALGDEAPDLYAPEMLYWHQDFRVLLAMKYVAELARQYGVRTEIQEVLAMPLGASEITLEEATLLYQGLCTAQAWDFPGEVGGILGATVGSPAAPTLLIAEIRDVDGAVLYRAEPTPRPVAAASSGVLTSDILRNVVRFGTGQRAVDAVSARSTDGAEAAVPVGGKTGTTNDFKNAAFIGYVPAADGAGYRVTDGWFVGVYVGYDDNRPMDVGNIRLAGASGALPAWIGTARGVIDSGHLGHPQGSAPSAPWWPLLVDDGFMGLPVDPTAGLPLAEGANSDKLGPALLAPVRPAEGSLVVRFERSQRPVRIAPRTEDAATLEPQPLWGTREDLPEAP